MADVDILPSRGIRAAALVDGNGIAINGTSTIAQLAQRGMRSICEVTPLGVAANGATLLQLAQRGIRVFCPVSELGVATDASTAEALRRRGIRPMVPVSATGVALTGSATILTLAQRGLDYFCPLNESGGATTLIDPTPLTLHVLPGDFRLSGEAMEPVAGWTVTAQAGAFSVPANSDTKLTPPVSAYTGPGDVAGWGTAYGYWGLRAYNASKIGANCIDVCANFTGAAVSLTTVVIGANGYADLSGIGFSPIYVNRIYDQSGTQDLHFPLIGGRPNIAASVVGGKPAILFPESYPIYSTANAVAQAQPLTYATVLSTTAGTGGLAPFGDGSNTSVPCFFNNSNQMFTNFGTYPDPTPCTDNVLHSIIVVAQGTTGSGTTRSIDGVRTTVGGNVGPNGIASTNKLTMGAGSDTGATLFRGYIFEVIVKAGSVSTTNQDLLTTNQHAIGTGW